MTWELGYCYGLASGGAAVGLIGLFVHAGFWERWGRQLAELRGQRGDAYRVADGFRDEADAARRERDEREALMTCYRRERDAALTAEAAAVSRANESDAHAANAARQFDGVLAERDAGRGELEAVTADRDAALAHFEAAVADRDTLHAQARGHREAVQAVTDERNAAAARADASDRRCQQAVADRARVYAGLREVTKVVMQTQKECS